MRYFSTLPKILVTDKTGNSVVATDILVRANIITEQFKNPLSYYKYDIKESDTPEIIAEKYYGDAYRYWIVLLVNDIMDPQFDWPMTSSVFNDYVTNKYTQEELFALHHYEKTVTQRELATDTLTTLSYEIDYDEYNSSEPLQATYTLPSGSVVVTTEKKAVSVYEYELQLNEDKRSIYLLNRSYVQDFENQFTALMN